MNISNFGVIEGRPVRPIVIKENKDGSKKALGTLAVQNNYKSKATGKKESNFIPFEGFIPAGTEGNGVYDLIHKGDKIAIQYELKSDSFTDKDGNPQYRIVVRVNSIELKESKAVTDARAAAADAEAEKATA